MRILSPHDGGGLPIHSPPEVLSPHGTFCTGWFQPPGLIGCSPGWINQVQASKLTSLPPVSAIFFPPTAQVPNSFIGSKGEHFQTLNYLHLSNKHSLPRGTYTQSGSEASKTPLQDPESTKASGKLVTVNLVTTCPFALASGGCPFKAWCTCSSKLI